MKVRVEDGIREGMMAGTEAPDQAGVVVVGCARSRSNGQRERVSHLKLVVRPSGLALVRGCVTVLWESQSILLGGSAHLSRIMLVVALCNCH